MNPAKIERIAGPAMEAVKVQKAELSPVECINLIMHGDASNQKRFPGVLYTNEEVEDGDPCPSDAVRVGGVWVCFGFHPGRLKASRAEVLAMRRC